MPRLVNRPPLYRLHKADDLFEKQPPREKRRLLDFVLSNSTWANGVLTPVFRQPFDLLADAAAITRTKKAAGNSSSGLHQVKLPQARAPANARRSRGPPYRWSYRYGSQFFARLRTRRDTPARVIIGVRDTCSAG